MIQEKDVRELLDAREDYEKKKAGAEEIREIYAATFEAEREAKARISVAETEIRKQAVEEFKETGEKTLSFGFKVKVSSSSELVYSKEEAVAFAQRNPELGLIDLNVAAFENAAAGLKLDFVSIKTTSKITAMIPKEIQIDED